MSPILTRPVREQLDHDRVIRLLEARYKRKNEVVINPGSEQNQAVTVGELVVYPDLLLLADGGKKIVGTIEVETGESVNALEARAEWAVFCKLKVPLHLYLPPSSVDAARRLCAEYNIPVAEFWTFQTAFDQVRFAMIYRSPDAPVVKLSTAPKATPRPVPKVAPVPVVKAAPVEKPAPVIKPAPAVKAKPPLRQGPGGPSQKARSVPKTKPAVKAKPPLRQGSGGKAQKAKAKPAPKSKPVAKAKAKPAPLRQGTGGHPKKRR